MQRNNLILVLIFSLFFKLPLYAKSAKDPVYIVFNNIKINDQLANIQRILGDENVKKTNNEEFIVLEILPNKLKSNDQIVITFNPKSETVISKFWAPNFDSKLLKLENLTKEKFNSVKFENFEPALCSDSPSSEVFLINKNLNLIIRYTRTTHDVVAVLWTNSEQYKIVLKKLSTCPKM